MAGQNLAGPPPKPPSASPHELGYGLAASPVSAALGTPSPRPEMMLGLWTSWVEYVSKLASDMGAAPGSSPGQASRQMSPDQFTGGLQQFDEMAAKEFDPELDSRRER